MPPADSPHRAPFPAPPDDRPGSSGRSVERRRDQAARERLLHRVLSEFREMPCLCLTPEQAQRLFGLRADISTRVISTLVAEGHLRLDSDGRYVATKTS